MELTDAGPRRVRAPQLNAALRRTAAELGLAATVAVGSRTTRLRTLLTVLGVALGVVVLLVAAAVPHAWAARERRAGATVAIYGAGSHARVHLLVESTLFHGVSIVENDVQVTGRTGPVPTPPGVPRVPGPGEMVISPEVAHLLGSRGGAELARRLRARVVGTIGPSGLAEPDDAVLYRGSGGRLADGMAPVLRFGGPAQNPFDLTMVTLLVIVVVVALLLPVAVFVVTAARFGSEERDRRMAAMRLLGADRAMTARIAAGEALVGALGGLLLGGVGFVVLAPVLARAGVAGIRVYAADLRPGAALAALVAALVPLCAVLATLISVRRAAVEPLGVSTRRVTRSRRLLWRLIVPAVGFGLLVPLIGSAESIGSTLGQVDATVGVILVLVGVTALLPWIVGLIVRRAPDGPLPWLLAIRRLRLEEGTTGRVIGAIGLAVAGAVALSVVFGAAQDHVRGDVSAANPWLLTVQFNAPDRAAAERGLAMIDHAPGVRRAQPDGPFAERGQFSASTNLFLSSAGSDGGAGVRDVAAAVDPLAMVISDTSGNTVEERALRDLRRLLFGGALVVLAMIGASLLVAAGEGMRDRRRALAVLSAVGTRRSTVAWALLVQAAVPVTAGLALAVVLGTALGAMLTAVVAVPLVYDWTGVMLMLAAGAAVIAAVTLLTLPALGRAMRPEALRVE